MSATDGSQQIVPVAGAPALAPLMAGAPASVGATEEAGGISARDMWRIVKQRKLLIIVTICVVYFLVCVLTFLTWKFWPAYSNEAFVQLVPPPSGYRGVLEESILPKDFIAMRLATCAAQIKNLSLLQEVLEQPEIKETKFYKWYGEDFDKCLYQFQDMLSVAPMRDTYLVRVAIAVRQREEARTIVNTVVQRYVSRSQSDFMDESRRKVETLKNTQATVANDLTQIRGRIRALREQRDMPALESERQVMMESIGVLTNTLSELKARLSDVQSQLDTRHGTDPRNLPVSAEMRVVIESDPVLRYYRQQVEALDIQMSALATVMGPEHRQMLLMRQQRQGYFDKEAARREELTDDLRNRQVESLEQERARIRSVMVEVHEQLIEKQNAQRDLDGAIQTFDNLTSDEERMSRQLEDIETALREANQTLEIQNRDARLQAIPAVRDIYLPTRPNLVLFLGGGFIASILIGLGLAFLRELTDQAVRTPVDVARYGRLSVLGSVPLLSDEEADVDQIELATRRAPHSLVAENFRQIRAHLTFSGPLGSQQALLITSPRPEDGKTATAINLAVTCAQGNQRVLLIDCNFRRPQIRAAFAQTRAEGLSNVLVGQRTLDQVIGHTELANLDIVASGPMPPNPAELLGSTQMRNLISEAKQRYDRILFDGPPCLLISDALVIATQVDATVMVVRAANSSKGALRRAREQFQRIGARLIGAILNGVQARPGGYFRQQYREFYEYTSEEVIPQELPGGPPEIDAGPAARRDERDAK